MVYKKLSLTVKLKIPPFLQLTVQLFVTPFRKHFFVGLVVGIILSIGLVLVSALSSGVFGVDYISSWYSRLFGFVTGITIIGSMGLWLLRSFGDSYSKNPDMILCLIVLLIATMMTLNVLNESTQLDNEIYSEEDIEIVKSENFKIMTTLYHYAVAIGWIYFIPRLTEPDQDPIEELRKKLLGNR